jgi:hypothetical protein
MNLLRTDGAGNPIELVSPIISMQKTEQDRTIDVDLIAAIHFADREYYDRLNTLFTRYEVLLVEMLAPKGTTLEQIAASAGKRPRKLSRIGVLATLQRGMAHALGLVNQLDAIDYSAKNMVLADMDAETLFRRFSENGEIRRFAGETLHNLIGEEEGPNEPGDGITKPELSLAGFLVSREKQRLIKRVFAVELARSLDEGSQPFERSLIRERNAVLLEELERQVNKGARRIGVFYGSAHIPDIQWYLEETGYRVTGREELVAWKL